MCIQMHRPLTASCSSAYHNHVFVSLSCFTQYTLALGIYFNGEVSQEVPYATFQSSPPAYACFPPASL